MSTTKFIQNPFQAVKTIFILLTFFLIQTNVEGQIINDPSQASSIYEASAVRCFIPLGEKTGGETYLSDPVYGVTETLIQIINTKVEDGTDIIFLIDQTGSMTDDIAKVKVGLARIISALNQWKDIRLGVAIYGDKNVDGPGWFQFQDLEKDFEAASDFIEKIGVSGGGDMPESVYDGITLTLQQASWRKKGKHMVLTIGDAPSLKPPKSDHTYEDVIRFCKNENVEVNLYPILINAR